MPLSPLGMGLSPLGTAPRPTGDGPLPDGDGPRPTGYGPLPAGDGASPHWGWASPQRGRPSPHRGSASNERSVEPALGYHPRSMSASPLPTAFAVLPAAGASRRMGLPKLLLPFRGAPLVAAVVAALRGGGVEGIVLDKAPGDEQLRN